MSKSLRSSNPKFGNMQQFRQSMMVDAKQVSGSRTSVVKSIARASTRFELQDGTDAGQMKIENERLKTTIMVLT